MKNKLKQALNTAFQKTRARNYWGHWLLLAKNKLSLNHGITQKIATNYYMKKLVNFKLDRRALLSRKSSELSSSSTTQAFHSNLREYPCFHQSEFPWQPGPRQNPFQSFPWNFQRHQRTQIWLCKVPRPRRRWSTRPRWKLPLRQFFWIWRHKYRWEDWCLQLARRCFLQYELLNKDCRVKLICNSLCCIYIRFFTDCSLLINN